MYTTIEPHLVVLPGWKRNLPTPSRNADYIPNTVRNAIFEEPKELPAKT
jgi:hypothetical protein